VNKKISILFFAYSVLRLRPYRWQGDAAMSVESGKRTALAACNGSGKTTTLFPLVALYLLYAFPRAQIVYLSASASQVAKQFFPNLHQYADHPAFKGWRFLETEIRTPEGGFILGRATDSGATIEGLHSKPGAPAALLVDEAKSIPPEVMSALERCRVTYRFYASSTGASAGAFYEIMTQGPDWQKYWVTSSECPHIKAEEIERDRQSMKPNVFAIAHESKFLSDDGTSMIPLEHYEACEQNPPPYMPSADKTAFVDWGGGSAETVMAFCDGNAVELALILRERDAMKTVGAVLALARKLQLKSYSIGGDFGYGATMMDRAEEAARELRIDLKWTRVSNGDSADLLPGNDRLFLNKSSEQWSLAGQLIEKKLLRLPKDPVLKHQLTSRRKYYDSRARERLETKDEMRARGLVSPDRADAFVGAIYLRLMKNIHSFDPAGAKLASDRWDLALSVQGKGGLEYGNGMDWADAMNGGSAVSECRFDSFGML
jgi:phage terminase large subunit